MYVKYSCEIQKNYKVLLYHEHNKENLFINMLLSVLEYKYY